VKECFCATCTFYLHVSTVEIKPLLLISANSWKILSAACVTAHVLFL